MLDLDLGPAIPNILQCIPVFLDRLLFELSCKNVQTWKHRNMDTRKHRNTETHSL